VCLAVCEGWNLNNTASAGQADTAFRLLQGETLTCIQQQLVKQLLMHSLPCCAFLCHSLSFHRMFGGPFNALTIYSMLYHLLLCCAVLCCAVLCCAVLCCAVPSVPCCAIPCYAASSFYAVLLRAMLFRTLPCCCISKHPVTIFATVWQSVTCSVILCNFLLSLWRCTMLYMPTQCCACCVLPCILCLAVPFLLFIAVPFEAMLCLCFDALVGQQPFPAMVHTHLL